MDSGGSSLAPESALRAVTNLSNCSSNLALSDSHPVKSAASLDYTKAPGGISFILDLHPTAVAGDSGLDKLTSLLKTYFGDGGMEIGLNIVSDEDLRAAQKDPNRYSHIMVRVFGFSTQFISLSRELQDYVIEKTKQVD